MTTYNYLVSNDTNIATKITTLTNKLNIDLSINQTVTSITYNAGLKELSIVYPLALSNTNIIVLNKEVRIIVEQETTDDIQPLPINTIQRQTFNSPSAPTANHDNLLNYNTGSIITNNNNVWICVNNATSNAIWRLLYPAPTFRDLQNAVVSDSGATFSTASTTFVDIAGMTVTTNNPTGNYKYNVTFSSAFASITNNLLVFVQLTLNGVAITGPLARYLQFGSEVSSGVLNCVLTNIPNGSIIRAQIRTNDGSGTVTVRYRSLTIDGSPM